MGVFPFAGNGNVLRAACLNSHILDVELSVGISYGVVVAAVGEVYRAHDSIYRLIVLSHRSDIICQP